MPCWQQRVEGPQWVQERYGPPIRAPRRRRPDQRWPARGQRWGDGAPPPRRSSATGRLRRWSPCSQALGRSPARGRRPRPPPWGLAPRQGLGDPVRAPGEVPRPLPWCAGVPCAPTGGNGPAGAPLPHAAALAPLDALGVLPPGRGAARRGGRRARARWCPTAGRPPAPERPAPAAQPPRPAPGCRARRPGPHASRGHTPASPRRPPRGRQSAGRRAAARRWSARHATTRRVGPRAPAARARRTAGRCARGPPPEAARDRPSPWPRGRAPQAHTPPERPPARQPRCRHASPPALRPRSPPPAAGHGWERASPKTRAPKAARHRARGGEDSPGLPHPGLSARGRSACLHAEALYTENEPSPAQPLRDTT